MAIQIEDIKNKPLENLKAAEVRLVGFNNQEFKQISTKSLVELNSNGKIPAQYLDFSNLKFIGVYDAYTNNPALSNLVGNNNEYYIVNVAGTQNFGSGNLTMKPKDNLVYYDNKWNLIPTENNLIYNNDIFL